MLGFIYCAESKISAKLFTKLIEDIKKINIPDFPFNGQYLINRGLHDGKKIGYALKELEKEWLQKDFNLKTEEVTSIVDKIKNQIY